MVKSPLYILHGWLPKAHVESPTTGSILLAGLLLKVGLFGAFKFFTLVVGNLILLTFISRVGIRVGSILASMSAERKVLVAYSSITHINLGLYRIRLGSNYLMTGRYLMCLSHGYISLLLFYLVGEIYHYRGTRILYYIRGILVFSGAISLIVVGV